LAALSALLKTPQLGGALARRAAEEFITGIPDKLTALRLLRRGEWSPLPNEVIHSLITRVEASLKLKCSRCEVVSNIPKMRAHVWEEHRLVLDTDGDRMLCREPWALIQDLLDRYRTNPDEGVLAYCLDLACRIDPHRGLRHLARLATRRGIDDRSVRKILAALPPEAVQEARDPEPPIGPNGTNPLRRLFAWCREMITKVSKGG
jgi:hypothetical protein